ELRKLRWPSRTIWMVGGAAVGLWLLIALASLPDLVVGSQRYYSVSAYDYMSRIPITAGIARQEKLPAQSPFLNPGQPVQLRYHYFWPMVCAAVKMAGFGAYNSRAATTAGALWC